MEVSDGSTKRILVVDIGGTNVKALATGQHDWRRFASNRRLSAKLAVKRVKEMVRDWEYESVTVGYPGPVVHGYIFGDPPNLGRGWIGFNFSKAFGGCPVKIVNDAALQALGSYHGGRMLYLGLGTGVGCVLIVDGILETLELDHLPYKGRKPYHHYLGMGGLERLGQKRWQSHVIDAVRRLKVFFDTEYVVLGGGNSRELTRLPRGTILADENAAFVGGSLMWKEAHLPIGYPIIADLTEGSAPPDQSKCPQLNSDRAESR
jgi:hypothetical protein